MKRCRSTVRVVLAHSTLTNSDLAYDEAVSRGLRCLAAAGSSPSPSCLPPVQPRPRPSQPPIQTGSSDPTHLLGPRRPPLPGAGRYGTARVHRLQPRHACVVALPWSAVMTLPNKRLKMTGGDRI